MQAASLLSSKPKVTDADIDEAMCWKYLPVRMFQSNSIGHQGCGRREPRMSAIENVSRRGFMKGMVSAGALVLSVRFLPETLWAEGLPKDTKVDHACVESSVYLGINTDGTVFIIAHRSEMGTGIRTSLPLVLADELEADWKRVKLEQAIGR